MVMISGVITKDGMSKCKVDPCGVFSLRVKANSVLCLPCGRCGKYVTVKRETQKF